MTVAFDKIQEFAISSTPTTVSFTPVGTPRAILVEVALETDLDHVASCTYGGVAMSLVDHAVDTAGEVGGAYTFFLGASIPTGAQNVVLTHTVTGGIDKIGYIKAFTAAADTEVVTFAKVEGDVANPSVALDTGAVSSIRSTILFGGGSAASYAALTGMVAVAGGNSASLGTTCAVASHQTTASTGSFTIGYTAVSDDVAMVAVAIQEVSGAPVVTPAVIAATASLPTPTVLAAATVTPAVIAATAALPLPTAQGQAKTTPAVIALTAALPTPTILAAAKVTPTTIAAVAALPTPSILAAALVTPAVIPVTVTLPTPTVNGGTAVSPAVIATTVSLPTPTIVSPKTVTPATIAAIAALPTPTIAAAALVTPAVIPVTVTLPTPTIVGPAAVVTPAVIAVTAALPTPTILAAVTVTPTTIAVIVGLPTPTVIGETTVMPATILVTVTFPGPTVILGAIKFWTVNPVAYALNPAGYDPIVGDDTPPLW